MSDHSSNPQDEIDQILAEMEAAHQATENFLAKSEVTIAEVEAKNTATQTKLDEEIVAEVDAVEATGMQLIDEIGTFESRGDEVQSVGGV